MSVPAQDRSTRATPSNTERLLAERPHYRPYIERIVAFEEQHREGGWIWRSRDVAVNPRVLSLLAAEHVTWIIARDRHPPRRWYKLMDLDETRGALEAVRRAR